MRLNRYIKRVVVLMIVLIAVVPSLSVSANTDQEELVERYSRSMSHDEIEYPYEAGHLLEQITILWV